MLPKHSMQMSKLCPHSKICRSCYWTCFDPCPHNFQRRSHHQYTATLNYRPHALPKSHLTQMHTSFHMLAHALSLHFRLDGSEFCEWIAALKSAVSFSVENGPDPPDAHTLGEQKWTVIKLFVRWFIIACKKWFHLKRKSDTLNLKLFVRSPLTTIQMIQAQNYFRPKFTRNPRTSQNRCRQTQSLGVFIGYVHFHKSEKCLKRGTNCVQSSTEQIPKTLTKYSELMANS